MKIGIKLTILFSLICFSHNIIVGAEQSKGFTVQNALVYMRRIIANFPRDNTVAAQAYEKNESALLVKSAYALYNNARVQILEALREIDNRKAYWLYQRDHQWQYFLTKNPIKWITGQSQDIEIQNNLDMLESHQGELYTLLGQLLEQGNIFNHGYKTTFIADYKKGYEWVDGLLDLLSRVRVPNYVIDESSSFMARAMKLKMKLEGVGYFRNDILSDIKETQIPSKLEQNWLKYGVLGLVLGAGYNAGGVEQIGKSFNFVKKEVTEYVVDPVKNLVEEVFVGGKKEEADKTKEKEKKESAVLIETLREARVAELELAKDFVDKMTQKYKIGNAEILKNALEERKYKEFRKFLEDIKENGPVLISSSWSPLESINVKVSAYEDYITGLVYSVDLFGFNSIKDLEESSLKLVEEKIEEKQKLVLDEFAKLQKQFSGVSKLVLLTPAFVTGVLAYAGYQQVSKKDYSQIRRALLDINSLFVDQTKPIEDERYGKMVYLLYNLKKLAEKDLTQKRNVRADFLQDLENIESKEFDVAAKRRIIDDMFRKYSFLGLVQ